MSEFNRIVPCSALIAAALLLGGPRLIGQTAAVPDSGRSFALHAAAATLPGALARVEAMLRIGDLDIASIQEDTMIPGRAHERLKQMYKGVPVFGGQVVRQMDGRSMISVNGRLYEGLDLDVSPQISPGRADEIALSSGGAGATVHGDTTLGVLPVGGQSYKLVYRMEVRSALDCRVYDVDAISGAIVRSISRLQPIATIGLGTGVLGDQKKVSASSVSSTFQTADGLRPASVFTVDFRGSSSRLNNFLNTAFLSTSDIATDADNVWTDGAIVDAHVYQGFVYDYYFKQFGRRGLDDDNLEIDGIVHPLARADAARYTPDTVGTFINNALWAGGYDVMIYGDGDGRNFNYLAGALDVVGHEMTHGVTQFSSDLTYQDESGALNEAFSDIMGASVEFFYQPVGSGPGRADWLIGEDVTLFSPRYLRSLNNPNAVGDPDHYSLRTLIGTNTDDGGVHTNMTIVTHAFYLAVAGGRNRVSQITVAGVGMNNIARIEKIFYRAFVLLMGPNSQFSDARAATLQAASDLYGSASNEFSQVQQAWTAVGVN